MTEINYRYSIRSRWRGRVDSPAGVGAKFLSTLDALSDIDPVFANWLVWELCKNSVFPLNAARSRIATIIENDVVRNDFDKPSPDLGYDAYARAGVFRDPRSVGFMVLAGGKYGSRTDLQFAEFDVAADPAILIYPLFKSALLALNAIWHAPWTCAQAFGSGVAKVSIDFGGVKATRMDSVARVPSDPSFPDTIFHIPWIAYLSAELSAGLNLTPEILTERTADGGLLMSVTTERFDPTNHKHLRGARIVAETLIAAAGTDWQ